MLCAFGVCECMRRRSAHDCIHPRILNVNREKFAWRARWQMRLLIAHNKFFHYFSIHMAWATSDFALFSLWNSIYAQICDGFVAVHLVAFPSTLPFNTTKPYNADCVCDSTKASWQTGDRLFSLFCERKRTYNFSLNEAIQAISTNYTWAYWVVEWNSFQKFHFIFP